MTANTIALVFDGDQTLWDFRSALDRALADTRVEICRITGTPLDAIPTIAEITAHRDHVALQTSGARLEAIRRESFARILGEIGVPASEETVMRVTQFFLGRRHEMCRPYADSVPALRALKGTYQLVLLSNGNSQPEHMGLGGLFDYTFFADDVGAEKPSPQAFAHVVNSCPATTFFSIGDSLEHDIDGAQACGWKTVWINRDGRALPEYFRPDATLSNLTGLSQVVERLSG